MHRMARKRTDVLDSIAATLLALAVLAEQTAGGSSLARWNTLWYIWQADAVVREFVAGSTWNPAGRQWSPALPPVRYGTGPADAFALAVSLRALALVVLNMAAQCRRSSHEQSGHAFDEAVRVCGILHVEASVARDTDWSAVELRDTS